MAAQQIGNASTVGFQVVAGRYLGPVEYPILIALLGIVMTFGYPMDALRTSFAHFSALLDHEGRRDEIPKLLKRWAAYLAVLGGLILAVGYLNREGLAAHLNLADSRGIVLTASILAGTLFIPVLAGTLQGVQAFGWFAATCHVWGVARLVMLIGLVYVVGQTAIMGLASQMFAVVVSLALGLTGVYCVLRRGRDDAAPIPGVMSYAVRSVVVLFGFAVLMSFDVVLAQAYFPGEADMYSRASTIGRSVIFFAQPIVMAMFPKVASKGSTSHTNWKNLLRAILYSMLAIVPLIGLVLVFPQLPIWVLYGKDYVTPDVIHTTRMVLLAMSPLGIVFLLMNFQLAQHRFLPVVPIVLCAAGYYLSVMLVHETIGQLILALGIASVLALACTIACLPWKSFALTEPEEKEALAAVPGEPV